MHHIGNDILFRLSEKGLIKNSGEAQQILEDYFSDKFVFYWSTEDIADKAGDMIIMLEDMNPAFMTPKAKEKLKVKLHIIMEDEEKKKEILHDLESRHDCSLGTTWDSVEGAIRDYADDRM